MVREGRGDAGEREVVGSRMRCGAVVAYLEDFEVGAAEMAVEEACYARHGTMCCAWWWERSAKRCCCL